MPIFREGELERPDAGAMVRTQPLPDTSFKPDPGLIEAIPAAFRQVNTVGSAVSYAMSGVPDLTPQPDYSSLDLIKGTKYETNHLNAFIGSPNEAHTRWLMQRLDKEDEDRETLAKSGWGGFVASLAAGMLDPVFMIPVTAAAATTARGFGAARTAAKFAAVGAGQGLASEVIMQNTQADRPFSESFSNVAANTIMMGILGGAVGKFLKPHEAARIESAIDDLRNVPESEVNPAAAREPVAMEAPELASASGREATGTGGARSAGAAAVDERLLEPVSLLGGLEKIPGVGRVLTSTSPTLRTFFGGFQTAKKAMAELAETSLRFIDNQTGIPTSVGIPISRAVHMDYMNLRLKQMDITRNIWEEMRFGENVPLGSVARSQLAELTGKVEQGVMEYNAFKKEIRNALLNKDTHENVHVQRAAQEIRKQVFEPILKAAQSGDNPLFKEADLLTPKGDLSYFPRIWSKERIKRDPTGFANKVTDWLENDQMRKAEAQERLQGIYSDYKVASRDLSRLDKRLENMETRLGKTAERLAEREMETKQAGKRYDTLEARTAELQDAINELQEVFDGIKDELRSPETAAHINRLEKELSALKKQAKPVTNSEIDRLERADVNEVFSDAKQREIAERALGMRKPKEFTLKDYLKSIGGVKTEIDRGGGNVFRIEELSGMLGKRSRLVDNVNGRSLDDIAEDFYQTAEWAFPNGPPRENEVIDILQRVDGGDYPDWWIENFLPDGEAEKVFAARQLQEFIQEVLGETPENMRDFAKKILLAEEKNPRLLDRFYEQATAENAIPEVEKILKAKRDGLDSLRSMLNKTRDKIVSKRVQGRVAGAKEGEAGIAKRRNEGRLGVLEDRMERQQVMLDLHTELRSLIEGKVDEYRGKMEAEVRAWEGDSSVEAMRALKARDEKTANAVSVPGGKRLTSADSAVEAFVKKVLESDRRLSREELYARSEEIRNRIMARPDGRLPYENSTSDGGPPIKRDVDESARRGGLHQREFAIPTQLISDFVEDDLDTVMDMFLRKVIPDIAIHNRFGDVEMRKVFRSLDEEASMKARQIANQPGKSAKQIAKEQMRLDNEHNKAIRDLAAVRDRIRNIYGYSDDFSMQRLGRLANTVRDYNSIVSLGSAAANSIPDAAGALYQYSFLSVFRDGYLPFLRSMNELNVAERGTRKSFHALGIGTETAMGMRRRALNDIADMYAPGTGIEKGTRWMADKFQVMNLQAPETDFFKMTTAYTSSHNIMSAIEKVAAGKGSKDDIAKLAQSSITPEQAGRIWKEFKAPGGGETKDGVHLPNFGDWADKDLANRFGAAVSRDVDMAVITPGQEKPLWMSRPVFGLLGQFKSFIAGMHERILIAGLQQHDAKTLQGLMTHVAIGMLAYKLYSVVAGKPTSDDPAQWVKEGMNRAGVLGWGDEINAITAKMTGGKMDVYRAIGADKPLSRYAARNAIGTLLGPTFGKVSDLQSIGRATATGDWRASDIAAARRLIWVQNHFLVRRALNQVEDSVAAQMGVEPAQRN